MTLSGLFGGRYSNSNKLVTHRHDLTPEKYAEFAMLWVGMGARIVGGCCEVGPAHIAHLAGKLKALGHELV